jgi:hypothetical protein
VPPSNSATPFRALIQQNGSVAKTLTYCQGVIKTGPLAGGDDSNAGKPARAGKPAGVGKPADAGQPANAGKPSSTGSTTTTDRPGSNAGSAASHVSPAAG